MKVALFYHSLISCWNHGNAHFLRGIATELQELGHEVRIFEPQDAWSVTSLLAEHGDEAVAGFKSAYPELHSERYEHLDLEEALDGADLVLVHEWNDQLLVRRIGEHRAVNRSYRLLFHDTHHRAVTDPEAMGAYDLSNYDGVLAYGNVLRDLYLERGWIGSAWTWHEAADVRMFRPHPEIKRTRDVVWIGNWGDEERTVELHEYLIRPLANMPLDALVHGVRYPEQGRKALAQAGIEYGGWLPNYKVPEVFAQFRVTLHIPRIPYTRALPGIPTIRPFEALACGIPMISAPWMDSEKLFTAGRDYLVAKDGGDVMRFVKALCHDKAMSREISEHGRRTILARHTCAHRVEELLGIYQSLSEEQLCHSL